MDGQSATATAGTDALVCVLTALGVWYLGEAPSDTSCVMATTLRLKM